jgi:hypothetical protein
MSNVTPEDYQSLFEHNQLGERILEDLTQKFARPQVTAGGIDAVLQTYERGGMRKVLEHIVNQINRANGVDANAEEHEVKT